MNLARSWENPSKISGTICKLGFWQLCFILAFVSYDTKQHMK